jgi:tetratricopeptide (TPR) repeat protein
MEGVIMKRVLAAVAVLLGLALFVPQAQAQTGTARGRVVDAQDKPVADAKVMLEYLGGVTRKFETKTNKKGEFIQVGMQPGNYRFTATKEGLRGAVLEFRIQLGEPTEVPPLKLGMGGGAPSDQAAAVEKLRKEFQAAVDLTNSGKLDEAEAAFKALVASNPDVPEIQQNLGFVYAQKKDYPAAEAAYLKALELKPDSSDILIALAGLYREMDQPDKAKEMADRAAAAAPEDPASQFRRGLFLVNSNQNEQAIAAFQAVIAADPTMAEAYFRLGTLMVGQSKIPEAIQYLEKYLSLNPTDQQNIATAQGLIKALKK